MMHSERSRSFGELLRHHRRAAGLTQEALAERAGLSARGIQNLERGIRRPLLDTLRRLLDALPLSDAERAELTASALPGAASPHPGGPPPLTPSVPSNLPAPMTSFVGRELQRAQLQGLLGTARLLTLTGPPGSGKTRLATQTALDAAGRFAQGACFVALAPIADPRLVASTIAHALGLGDAGRRPVLDGLIEHLRPLQTLLVLDNFEQVVDAAPDIASLLAACPALTVLATSRQSLRLYGEYELAVPPLALPDPTRHHSYDAITEFEAIRLFADRAVAVRPDFALTPDNAATVAEICRRLDGLPLAIELAAARLKLVPVTHLLERLEQRLPFLVGGPRDVLPHHRDLRATIAWSYDLLDDDEQAVFRRLSAFVGGCSLDAAAEVTAAGASTLAIVTSLAEKCLIQCEQVDGAPRVRLLETIREYGQEMLLHCGEDEDTRGRHAAYYLTLAEATSRGPAGFAALEREHDNLRSAFDWYLKGADAEHALRFGAALWAMWAVRGYVAEGRSRLAAMLSVPEAASMAKLRAGVLHAAGRMAFNQGDFDAARSLYDQDLAAWRALGDPVQIVVALCALGHLAREQGDFARARQVLTEGLDLARESCEPYSMVDPLNYLGLLAIQEGDYALARERFEACLAILEQVGPERGLTTYAFCRTRLGIVAHAQGRREEARSLYDSGLATLRAWGDTRGIANLLISLALVDVDDGARDAALLRLGEARALLQKTRDRAGLAMWLEACAGLAAVQQDPERALALAAAAEVARDNLGVVRPRNIQDWIEGRLAAAQSALGDMRAASARALGRGMALDEAIASGLVGETTYAVRHGSADAAPRR